MTHKVRLDDGLVEVDTAVRGQFVLYLDERSGVWSVAPAEPPSSTVKSNPESALAEVAVKEDSIDDEALMFFAD